MKTLRLLTTVHFANPGACLFTENLYRILAEGLPDYQVKVLDYVPGNWLAHETLRTFKPQPGAPLFNLQRHLLTERFYNHAIPLDRPVWLYPLGYKGMERFLAHQGYDALVVGMVIWDITTQSNIPTFPSIFWLSDNLPAVKIAFAASGHRSHDALIAANRSAIQRLLGSFALVGVRDQLTWEMAQQAGIANVFRTPDPTFTYDYPKTQVGKIMSAHGLDLNRPLLGVAWYGKAEFSRQVCQHYRQLGFQTVALSMYNPWADVNLGHRITPWEWADTFRYLSFCITDRFHGSIFCLKANLPFIAIEPYAPRTLKNSKIYSLLSDFELTDLYMDTYQEGFQVAAFLERAESVRRDWLAYYAPKVTLKLNEMRQRNLDFIEKIKLGLA